MKRISILVSLVLIFLCGCSGKSNEQSVTPCEDLITQQVEISEAAIAVNYFSYFSHSGLFIAYQELAKNLPVECTREKDGIRYVVFDIAEGGRAYVFFKGDLVDYGVWVKEPLEWKKFKKLRVGDTMADVAEVDPVIALCSGKTTETKHNFHYISTADETGEPYRYPITFHLLDDRLVVIEYETPADFDWEITESVKSDLVIKKIGVYKDFVYEVTGPTAMAGKYDFSIYKQDMVK